MYLFELSPFYIEFRKHPNGVIAILSHDERRDNITLGINIDNNVYTMEKFIWYNVNDRGYGDENDGSDINEINDSNKKDKKIKKDYSGAEGLIKYIFDIYMKEINDLDDKCKKIMEVLADDILKNKLIDWIPESEYYTFENQNVITH